MKDEALLELKNRINKARTANDKLKGKIEAAEAKLLEQWNCKTIAEAEKKIRQMGKEITDLESQINKGIKTCEHQLDV